VQGWIRLQCLHEESFVRLEVVDTGIGIPADQLPLIYDEFYQVGVPTNSSREGYGLGLSIVQRLVKLLQLELQVHSMVGKGSVFSLLLPAAAVVHKPPAKCLKSTLQTLSRPAARAAAGGR
jgi:signal transduction histidine kinase